MAVEPNEEQEGQGTQAGTGTQAAVLRTGRRQAKSPGFRLQERDYDVFGFLLDQKFASLEALYFRFFDARTSPADPLPRHLFVARQRLGILSRAGLLTTQRVYSEPKSLYLLSPQGFHAFRARRDPDAYAPPIREVDFRNYEHDQAVTYCRVAIERQHKAMKWYCERRLRMQSFSVEGVRAELPEAIVPDAIFISSKGERIAFELEYTHRKKSRYEAKVEEYESVMGGSRPLLHKVLFVGGNDRVYRDLKDVLGERRGFWLESYGHFLGRLFPPAPAAAALRKLRDPRTIESGMAGLNQEGRR